ncbi:MAG: hypothetical protein ACQEQV_03730 [Fibrobacterota bacterium]
MGGTLQTAIAVLLLCAAVLYGADSAAVHQYSTDVSYYLNSLDLRSSWNMERVGPSRVFSQNAYYDLDYDSDLKTSRHHLTAKGRLLRMTPAGGFGVEWKPAFYINRRIAVPGYGVASLSLGPSVESRLWGIPLELSGGMSMDVWSNDLQRDFVSTSMDSTTTDLGGYFTFAGGSDTRALIPDIPLFAEGAVTGRYMNQGVNTRVTSGVGSLAWRSGARSVWDSLRVHLSDTLIHGRVGNVYGYSGNLETVPVRVDNITAFDLDCRGFSLNLFDALPDPHLSLDLFQEFYYYPFREDRVSRIRRSVEPGISLPALDLRDSTVTVENAFSAVMSQVTHLYRGEDRQSPYYDSLQRVHTIRDARIFSPTYKTAVTLRFPRRISLTGKLDIMREEKVYPRTVDSVSWNMDLEKQFLTRSLNLEWGVSDALSLTAGWSALRERSYFMHPSQSARSFERTLASLESGASYTGQNATAQVRAGAGAESLEYVYGDSTHERTFFVRSSGEYRLSDECALLGEGRLYNYDNGDLQDLVYRITRRSREGAGGAGIRWRREETGQIRFFTEGRVTRYYDWNYGSQSYDQSRVYRVVTPALSGTWTGGTFMDVRGEIRRFFTVGKTPYRNRWDLSVTVSGKV